MGYKVKRRNVEFMVEEYTCDCGGVFLPTGISYAVLPPIHLYECNKCKQQLEVSENGVRLIRKE